jgi:hypothetical protein
VNNGAQPRAQDKIPNQTNELLRAQGGDFLEQLPATAASAADPTLEAVGMVNRAKDGQR